METSPRHQCLVYAGPPSRHLLAIAAVMSEKLRQGHRCMYLNSRPMVAGLRSYLAAAGVDVIAEISRGSLFLSSEQDCVVDGCFEIERMIASLEAAVDGAVRDGFVGLWASGDLTWEFGSDRDFSKLLEYEWKLEGLFGRKAALSGICQYHTDTLPREATRLGLVSHPAIFINETLSLINPHYVREQSLFSHVAPYPDLDSAVIRLCKSGTMA
jgi:hypothetical protein